MGKSGPPWFHSVVLTYSGGNWKVYEYCFMKQKCQLQMGIAQYKNVATPLRTRGLKTTPASVGFFYCPTAVVKKIHPLIT